VHLEGDTELNGLHVTFMVPKSTKHFINIKPRAIIMLVKRKATVNVF
jgi:hypothetical protein